MLLQHHCYQLYHYLLFALSDNFDFISCCFFILELSFHILYEMPLICNLNSVTLIQKFTALFHFDFCSLHEAIDVHSESLEFSFNYLNLLI